MIRLEDLKVGDIIYRVYQYHWVMQYKVDKSKYEFEYQRLNQPIEYAVKLINMTDKVWCKGNSNYVFEKNEIELFKTLEEAEEYMRQCKQEKINYLLKDNNLVKSLYNIAKDSMSDADREIYKELINQNESIKRALRCSKASVELSGLTVSKENDDICRRLLKGEITEEEANRLILESCGIKEVR